MRRLNPFLLVLALLVTQAFAAGVDREDVLRVTGNIVCTCGCPPTLVRACSCTRAEEMTKEVESLLAAGKTDDEVYQYYVAQFGPKVLAAPKPEGFNLLGWVFPFIALAIGGGVVLMVYKRLRTTEAISGVATAPSAPPARDRERLEKMLKDALSED